MCLLLTLIHSCSFYFPHICCSLFLASISSSSLGIHFLKLCSLLFPLGEYSVSFLSLAYSFVSRFTNGHLLSLELFSTVTFSRLQIRWFSQSNNSKSCAYSLFEKMFIIVWAFIMWWVSIFFSLFFVSLDIYSSVLLQVMLQIKLFYSFN